MANYFFFPYNVEIKTYQKLNGDIEQKIEGKLIGFNMVTGKLIFNYKEKEKHKVKNKEEMESEVVKKFTAKIVRKIYEKLMKL